MKHENPCMNCPSSITGCGKHAECELYLAYYEKRKELSQSRIDRNILNDYTTKEIKKSVTRGCHNTFRKYRSNGRRI